MSHESSRPLLRRAGRALLAMGLTMWAVPGLLFAESDEARAVATPPEDPGRPFLWRIEAEPPSWLFGTIHLPDPRVLDLAPPVVDAFERSDVVYTEIPMDEATQMRAVQLSTLPAGQSLETVLPEALHSRLERYATSRGIPMLALNQLRVWAVTTALPLLDWMKNPPGKPPLDRALAESAEKLGKGMDALETIEEQIGALESMGREGEIAMLRQTLEYLEEAARTGEDPVEALLVAYLTGDEQELLEVSNAYLAEDDPLSARVEKALIFDRNRTMTETIRKKLALAPGKSHFFAVGALHYPGDQGIVALLRAEGVKVVRVDPEPAEAADSSD